jgi:outer membrane receptor protein involved in Fe transport
MAIIYATMKKKMRILLSVVAILTSSVGWAQSQQGNGKITGTVIDNSNQQPVEFATIALEDPATGKPVNGTVADEKGKFTITKVAEGTYRVVISFIGYENITVNNVIISDKKSNIDLGTQKLGTSVKQLDEVVVQGQRQLVEEKVDRMVYNAENDNTTKGGDGTDVLRRVPMLTVDMDGNVSMRGNSNIRVLINGKPSSIAATSVSDALKQIPADEIKSVEVITSPSAKYDAEGSAGIINIITKKNNLQGFSLGVDGSAGYRGSNLGLNGSLRTGKMGFSLGGFGRSNYNVTGKYSNTQITNTITTQDATTLNRGLFGNYNLGWDYDINKYNSLTASVRIGARNGRNFQNDLFTQRTNLNGTEAGNSLRNSDTKDNSENMDASLTYLRTFETAGKEFSIMGSFNRNNRMNNFINDISMVNGFNVDSLIKNDNKSYNQEMTIQADYQTPLAKKHILEFGAKNIARSVSSKYSYLYSSNGEDYKPSTLAGLNNDFDYSQNITAGYAAFTLALPKSFSLKAGSRYEYTTIDAKFVNQEKVTIPSYGVIVPSVNLSKKLANGNTLKLAYNRRIQRPSLQYLNPNTQASNPLSITVGNPSLSPEYTNNYELSYSLMIKSTSLNFSTFVRNTTQAIQSVRDTITFNGLHGVSRTTYQNIGKEDAYGGSLFANVNISSKFSLNGGTDVYYAVLNNNNPNPIYAAKNQGWVYNVRMFGNYNFAPKYGLQFFGFYRGRQVQLQGFQGGFAMYSVSLKRDIANKKGSIGVGVENFLNFNGWKIKNETTTPIITSNSVNVMNNLSFKVTFSYRIGKMGFDQPKRRKSINNDDLKSEGEGGGGGMDNGGGQQQQGGGQRGMGQQGGGRQQGTATPNLKQAAADPTAVVNAEGTWSYTIDSPQAGAGKIVIKKEGDKYTGTITNNRNNKETPLSTVTVNGNEINIGYEVSFNGNTMPVTIKGTIKGDELNGTTSVGQFGTFPINGKREKK